MHEHFMTNVTSLVFTTLSKQRMPPAEEELPTLPELLNLFWPTRTHPGYCRVCVTLALVFGMVVCVLWLSFFLFATICLLI